MLKELRKARNLTQRELSLLSGVDVMKISKIETGAIKIENITLGTAFKLAKALHVSVESLVK